MKFRSLRLLRERARLWPGQIRRRYHDFRLRLRRWWKGLPARLLRSAFTVYAKLFSQFIRYWLGLGRFVPRLGIWAAATLIYDMSAETNFRWWIDVAFENPDRQLCCCVRLLQGLEVPIYGMKLPSRVACRLPDSEVMGLRPMIGQNSLSTILEPTWPVYTGVSVPVTSILRAIRFVRKK